MYTCDISDDRYNAYCKIEIECRYFDPHGCHSCTIIADFIVQKGYIINMHIEKSIFELLLGYYYNVFLTFLINLLKIDNNLLFGRS